MRLGHGRRSQPDGRDGPLGGQGLRGKPASRPGGGLENIVPPKVRARGWFRVGGSERFWAALFLCESEFLMGAKRPPPSLTIVGALDATGPPPPASLDDSGKRLWLAVQAEYDVSDVCGLQLLEQACKAADRAESLAQTISEDGAAIRGRSGLRAHPLLAAELSTRGFITRTLIRLGINFEPVHRGIGRPPGKGAA